MKALALLVVLAGCVEASSGVGDPPSTCSEDSQCGTGVCASTGECMSADETQTARVTWTINGQAPDDYLCYWTTSFKAVFQASPEIGPDQETWDSPQLACTAGTFTIEKLPRRFWIGGATSQSNGMWVPLDETGVAAVNLTP
ncbi:MAG TPA: hypothetical protein VGM39_14160 [Kofleriaceae bacterium]|jgi:hypothetical protein